jgi:uncharacterized protein (TIGR02265 family)
VETFEGELSTDVTGLNLEWVRANLGDAVAETVLDEATDAVDVDVRGALTGDWIPYRVHAALLEAVADRVDEEGLRSMGAYGARNLDGPVPGFTKILAFFGPERLLRRADDVWDRYATFGELRTPHIDEGEATLVLDEFPSVHPFCTSLEGFFEGLLRRLDAQDVRVRQTACMANAGAVCRFDGTWR